MQRKESGDEGPDSPTTTPTTASRVPVPTPSDPLRAAALRDPTMSASNPNLPPRIEEKKTITRPKNPFAGLLSQTDTLSQRRKELMSKITEDVDGIKSLIKVGAWNAALALSEKLYARTRLPHEKLLLKLNVVVCLMKLHYYKKAFEEIQSQGNLDDRTLCYEHYPQLYPNKRGSMVPFSLRVLYAELPSFFDPEHVIRSIDMLNELLTYCRAQIAKLQMKMKKVSEKAENSSENSNENSPNSPSSTTSTTSGLTIDDLELLAGSSGNNKNTKTSPLLRKDGPFMNDAVEGQDALQMWRQREVLLLLSISTRLYKIFDFRNAIKILNELVALYPKDVALVSTIGRLHLQWGNVAMAEEYFLRVEDMLAKPSKSTLVRMNRAFLAIARDDYAESIRNFQAVLDREPGNISAANNKAICYLYMCDLAQAISSLEELICADPENALTETTVFNLCTLYDLASDQSVEKKKTVSQLVAKFTGDDFDVTVLKLT